MVAIVHKWSMISYISVLVMFMPVAVQGKLIMNKDNPHPLHVTVTEITHNATDKILEISVKLFTDDFERVLVQNYNKKVDLINPGDRAAMERLVNDYVHRHLIIRADGKTVPFTILGFEKDNDAIYCYFQVAEVKTVKTIASTNTLMHDMFTDQINLMHIVVGGKRQSTKMTYPEKAASITF